ncbi:MAG: DUF4363 family protein [Oscillospiraceae bacterium]|nr:DUF4363 family protein [Oscillospiraceae bacterium]
MRRLWISCIVLAALFCATLLNTCYLKRCTEEWISLLTQAEELVEAGDWEAAYERTQSAYNQWESRDVYLHMILQHEDVDEILLGFQQVLQLLEHQEDGGEYFASNAGLIASIGLLYETEQLNLKNFM